MKQGVGAIVQASALLAAANDRRWGATGVYQFAPAATALVPELDATNNGATEDVSLTASSCVDGAPGARVLAVASLEELVRFRARAP